MDTAADTPHRADMAAPKPKPANIGGTIGFGFYGSDRSDDITEVTVLIPDGTTIDPVLGAEVTVTLKVVELRRTETL